MSPDYGETPDYSGLFKLMVDETAAAAEHCIDEVAKAATASYNKLEGGYAANEMAQDLANWWVLTVREGARFADIWLRVARKAGEGQPGSATRTTTKTGAKS
jgi:hypothetical protein